MWPIKFAFLLLIPSANFFLPHIPLTTPSFVLFSLQLIFSVLCQKFSKYFLSLLLMITWCHWCIYCNAPHKILIFSKLNVNSSVSQKIAEYSTKCHFSKCSSTIKLPLLIIRLPRYLKDSDSSNINPFVITFTMVLSLVILCHICFHSKLLTLLNYFIQHLLKSVSLSTIIPDHLHIWFWQMLR